MRGLQCSACNLDEVPGATVARPEMVNAADGGRQTPLRRTAPAPIPFHRTGKDAKDDSVAECSGVDGGRGPWADPNAFNGPAGENYAVASFAFIRKVTRKK